jgi:hypothetical protein
MMADPDEGDEIDGFGFLRDSRSLQVDLDRFEDTDEVVTLFADVNPEEQQNNRYSS